MLLCDIYWVVQEWCKALYPRADKLIYKSKTDLLFLASLGDITIGDTNGKSVNYLKGPRWENEIRAGIQKQLSKWINHTKVFIFLPTDVPNISVPECLAKFAKYNYTTMGSKCDAPLAPLPHQVLYRKLLIEEAARFPNAARAIDARNFHCPTGICKALTSDGKPTWLDRMHLSHEVIADSGYDQPLLKLLERNCINIEKGTATLPCPNATVVV